MLHAALRFCRCQRRLRRSFSIAASLQSLLIGIRFNDCTTNASFAGLVQKDSRNQFFRSFGAKFLNVDGNCMSVLFVKIHVFCSRRRFTKSFCHSVTSAVSIVFHLADHQATHLMVFCPQFYFTSVLKVWQDTTNFAHVCQSTERCKIQIHGSIPGAIRRKYAWGINANARLPQGFVSVPVMPLSQKSYNVALPPPSSR